MTRFRPSCNGRVPAATNVDGKFEQGHPITHVKLLPCFSWDLHCWKGISFDFSFSTETEHSLYLLHQSPYNYFFREYLQCILSLWIIIHYLAAKQTNKSALLHTPKKNREPTWCSSSKPSKSRQYSSERKCAADKKPGAASETCGIWPSISSVKSQVHFRG